MIVIRQLKKSFGAVQVLKGVDVTIGAGDIYGLVGRSGAGKSTLLRCINGLDSYDSGSLTVGGIEVKAQSRAQLNTFRRNIGMIFQQFSILSRRTVYENVSLPMRCWGVPRREIDRRARDLVHLVGLDEQIDQRSSTLSGGQKQRVAIARALTLEPKILLCDEATSALDPKTTKDILDLLRRINRELGITIVIVTHQMSVVRQVCNRVSLLEDGTLALDGDVRDIFMRQPPALKRLLGAEAMALPAGCNVKICLDADQSDVISRLTLAIGAPLAIVDGGVLHIPGSDVARYVINVSDGHRRPVLDFLAANGITHELVTDELQVTGGED